MITHGVNPARRVPCLFSPIHGHFPANEKCPWCDPVPLADTLEKVEAPAEEYYYASGWPYGTFP